MGLKDRHEAATHDPAGQRRVAKGHGLPEATGQPKAVPADPALETGKVMGAAETRRNPPDFAPQTGEAGAESFWSLSGVPADAFVWPDTGTRKKAVRGVLARLRGATSGDGGKRSGIGPEMPESGPKDAIPVNVRPWTWEILPHVSETREGSPLSRLMDRVVWHATLPDARYVLLAERRRRRAESLFARALVRFAATFAGKPAGPPPWFGESRYGEGA